MRQVQTQVSEAKLENVNVHGSLLVLHPLPLTSKCACQETCVMQGHDRNLCRMTILLYMIVGV